MNPGSIAPGFMTRLTILCTSRCIPQGYWLLAGRRFGSEDDFRSSKLHQGHTWKLSQRQLGESESPHLWDRRCTDIAAILGSSRKSFTQ